MSPSESTGAAAVRGEDQKFCFSCGQLMHLAADSCPACGARQMQATSGGAVARAGPPGALAPRAILEGAYCYACGHAMHAAAIACPACGAPQRHAARGLRRSKSTAALLAFFFGGLGVHKFYLGQTAWGVLYLIFCWTFVPAVVALVEGVLYLSQSDDDFSRAYDR